MNMLENEFTEKLIQDLQLKKINVVNIGGGTFDLIIEGIRPFVCEIKRITKGGLKGYEEDKKGFPFTKIQSKEISDMKFPPFVIAYYNDDYYFFEPDWIKKRVTDLTKVYGYDKAIINEKTKTGKPWPPAKKYDEILSEIIKFISE